MAEYVRNASLLRKILKYLSNQMKDKTPNLQQLQYVIEPFCSIVKLAMLSYYPEGTKISIGNNTIQFVKPTVLQGTFRWSSGDKREDLHYLLRPIQKASEWYKKELENYNDLGELFNKSILGLENLKLSYTDSSTITCHSLDRYIDIINKVFKESIEISITKKKYQTRSQKKNITDEDIEEQEDILENEKLFKTPKNKTELGKNFINLWTNSKINIILNLFREIDNDIENKELYLKAVNIIVDIIEKDVKKVLYDIHTYKEEEKEI